MATAGTKLTILSRFFTSNVNSKPLRLMGSGPSFNGVAKYSTSAATVVKDYEDYRKSLYGDITHKALLVDAVGTLVVPSQPMAQVLMSVCVLISGFGMCWLCGLCYGVSKRRCLC